MKWLMSKEGGGELTGCPSVSFSYRVVHVSTMPLVKAFSYRVAHLSIMSLGITIAWHT